MSIRICSILMIALAFAPSMATAQYPINKADTRENPKIARAFREVAAEARASVVRVVGDGKELALGVIVDADGWILTKANDLMAAKKITVRLKNMDDAEAKIVGLHDAYDLLMLKIEADDLKAIRWSDAKDAKPGRWVASVGVSEDPAAIGVVSVGARKLVVNDQPPRNTNINAGFLGVGLEAGEGGAKVTLVERGAAASRAGIKVNDLIFEAAGQKILDQESLINVVQRHRPNDHVEQPNCHHCRCAPAKLRLRRHFHPRQ